jgi:glycolate oxidase
MAQLAQLRTRLERLLGPGAVLADPVGRMLYEYDGGVDKALPDLVVFPRSRDDVAAIVRLCAAANVPIVPRGAGTGLSGGAIARDGGVIVSTTRMRSVLEVDVENSRAVVQPGVVNLEFSESIAATGFYFAPDPSSQKSCTIGGNVAENSGGPHTLACGVTVNHVTGLEMVLADGSVLQSGGTALDPPGYDLDYSAGYEYRQDNSRDARYENSYDSRHELRHDIPYDLTGVIVGSEGTLGIVTAVTVRLTRLPEAARTLLAIYDRVEDAAATVTAITAAGVTPAALEMLDGFSLRAIEAATHAGYPLDSAAVLLIEVEGLLEQVEEESARIAAICAAAGARATRIASAAAERALLWKGRKQAFGAMGRIAPNFYVMDGVIPRTRIAGVLAGIERIGQACGLRIGNIFHAGDGNLHPLVFFDGRDPAQFERALAASREIIALCVENGGSISGEHGIGMEKDSLMGLVFSEADLDFMARLKRVFNPGNILNPHKVLPVNRSCRETRVDAPAAGEVYRRLAEEEEAVPIVEAAECTKPEG